MDAELERYQKKVRAKHPYAKCRQRKAVYFVTVKMWEEEVELGSGFDVKAAWRSAAGAVK